MRARLGLGIAAAAAVLLSGCAAGQHAATSQKLSAIDGTSADAGPIAIRAIAFAPPTGESYSTGSDVPLEFVLANTGHKPDQLVSISSPNFSSPTSTTLSVAPGTAVRVGIENGDPKVELTGLNNAPGDAQGLFPGQSIPVTFTFKSAGEVTAQVPVHLTGKANTASVPAPSGAPEE